MITSSDPNEFEFRVFETEPVMRLLVYAGLTPVTLGIAFFLFVSVCLSVIAHQLGPVDNDTFYLTYFENISWSISMLCIFPLVVGLTMRYYQEIPQLFVDLSAELKPEEKEKEYGAFVTWLKKRFNSPLVPLTSILLTLWLSRDYFRDIIGTERRSAWITDGTLLSDVFGTTTGLSPAGLFAAIVQTILIYWVLNLIWRGFVLSWGLHRFFNFHRFTINIEPLHPDKCCGLRRIGEVGMILNAILFLIGTYLSLKVIDKTLIQERALDSDIGNPLFLGAYVVLAPTLFFLPLSAAHQRMKLAKDEFLSHIRETYKALIGQLKSSGNKELIEEINELDSLYITLDKKVPVWPLNMKSIEAFFGTVIVPVAPIALPFLVDLAKKLVS